jgi:4-carboxymuconolactone decarboxylase
VALRSPKERSDTGVRQQIELLGAPAAEPKTLFEASWRDYVFAEVWTRPGLDRRSRFIITISSAVCSNAPSDILEGYIRGALKLGELTVPELREMVLHLAVYKGWSHGAVFDRAVSKVAATLMLPPGEYLPIRGEPWDPEVRYEEGQANFKTVMVFPSPPPVTAYFEGGIVNFVFAEMWMRPGLDRRARRWVTLVCVADSASQTPIRSHTHAAMAARDATREEMFEFVLQYAIHGSWPKASVMQTVVAEMADKVEKGLPFI